MIDRTVVTHLNIVWEQGSSNLITEGAILKTSEFLTQHNLSTLAPIFVYFLAFNFRLAKTFPEIQS